jgi:hypothetical protein
VLTEDDREQVERDALERYWRAVELADAVRAEWEAAGRPLVVEWPNGTQSEAPLLRLLREAERDAERLARALPKPTKRPGRNPVAVVTPTIGVSPAVRRRRGKLRAV